MIQLKQPKHKIKFKNFFGETESQEYLDVEKRLDIVRRETIKTHEDKEANNPLTGQEYILACQEQGLAIGDTTRMISQDSIVRQKKILKDFGWDQDLREIEEGKSQNIDRTEEEESFKDNIYYEKEIKEVCMDFNLRFKPTKKLAYSDSDFKYDLAIEIDRYCSQMRLSNGVEYEAGRFYALAIEEDFVSDSNKKAFNKKPNLMLFYMTNSKKRTFVHVKSWGNQKFSRLRYIKAWMRRNEYNYFAGLTLQFFAALMLAFSSLGFFNLFSILASIGLGGFASWHIANKKKEGDELFFTEKAFNK